MTDLIKNPKCWALFFWIITSTPFLSSQETDNYVDLGLGYSWGLNHKGPELSIQWRENWGPHLGLWTRLTQQDLDPVEGLEIRQFSWEVQPHGGWSWTPGPFLLGLGVFLSMEGFSLEESVVDSLHGIDAQYSAFSWRYDLGIHGQAIWQVWGSWGLGSGIHFSVLDPRRSHVFVSTHYAWPVLNHWN